jgi:hypothetical protein
MNSTHSPWLWLPGMVAVQSSGRRVAPPGESGGMGVMVPRMVTVLVGWSGSLVRMVNVRSKGPSGRSAVFSVRS